MKTALPIAIIIAATSLAHADASLDSAPLPGDESGRVDRDPGDSSLRKAVRGALFLPKVAVEVAFKPIEGSAWAFERYQLAERARRWFFNDDETIGLFPTFTLRSGFGVNIGARFVHRDVFGANEHLDAKVSSGGQFEETAVASFRTGNRFDGLTLGASGEFERRAKDSFYGIGNMDVGEAGTYRHRIARATASFDLALVGDLHLRGAGQLVDHEVDADFAADAGMDALTGFGHVRETYSELEARYDSRRRASEWEPQSVPATGWLVATFLGHTADYLRYGGEVQRFFALAAGPRVLSLRARAEAVTGSIADVPFFDLPRLGGSTSLRGYPGDRFRDRIAVSGAIEYQWDLGRFVSASVFVDAGKVAPEWRALDAHDLRIGYGIALDAHASRTFLARATLASSVDGGVFLDIDLDPVFAVAERTKRR